MHEAHLSICSSNGTFSGKNFKQPPQNIFKSRFLSQPAHNLKSLDQTDNESPGVFEKQAVHLMQVSHLKSDGAERLLVLISCL